MQFTTILARSDIMRKPNFAREEIYVNQYLKISPKLGIIVLNLNGLLQFFGDM